jgi:hypothetical protein
MCFKMMSAATAQIALHAHSNGVSVHPPKVTTGYYPDPAPKQEEQSHYDHEIERAKHAIKPNPQLSVA